MSPFDPVSERFDFPAEEAAVSKLWKDRSIFQQSLENREGAPTFVFYEGPPTATASRIRATC